MPEANTPDLWDRAWARETSPEEDAYALALEENSIRWHRLEQRVLDAFGSFEGLDVIEIGAGSGMNALLAARRGATVTLLDYSQAALSRASVSFERSGSEAELVQADALDLGPELLGRFDVSMSFGLAEHFEGEDRLRIVGAHLDVLRRGGITFISVPNRFNPPYRLFKAAAELSGRWTAGEEYPFSRGELARACRTLGVSEFDFFGDSLANSLRFVNPMEVARKMRGIRPPGDIARVKKERGTPLDAYVAYALVLEAKKS
jgi:SAM-dependent methyltransferase